MFPEQRDQMSELFAVYQFCAIAMSLLRHINIYLYIQIGYLRR